MTPLPQPLAGIPWYDVPDYNSPALDELARKLSLHELQIEDCRHPPQRAKLEDHEGYIFAVLKRLRRDPEPGHDLKFADVDVFLCKDTLITVHSGERDLVERTSKRTQECAQPRVDRTFYYLLDCIVDEYIPLLDTLAEESAEIEAAVLEHPDPPMLRRIFALKRRLIEFRRVAGGMRDVVNALMRIEQGLMGDDLDPYLRDVYDHLVRSVDLAETYRDLLTGALDIYLSAVANRTNQVMKVLTVYGTVALPLIIITGYFGMNLHLPLQESPHGLLYANGLMALSTLAVLYYFRRKGWF